MKKRRRRKHIRRYTAGVRWLFQNITYIRQPQKMSLAPPWQPSQGYEAPSCFERKGRSIVEVKIKKRMDNIF
jgi:hypothetical protein